MWTCQRQEDFLSNYKYALWLSSHSLSLCEQHTLLNDDTRNTIRSSQNSEISSSSSSSSAFRRWSSHADDNGARPRACRIRLSVTGMINFVALCSSNSIFVFYFLWKRPKTCPIFLLLFRLYQKRFLFWLLKMRQKELSAKFKRLFSILTITVFWVTWRKLKSILVVL